MATESTLLVKYSNVMNEITLAHLKPSELDMFVYILAMAKNRQDQVVAIDDELFISILDPKKQVFTSETKLKKGVYNLRKKVNELYAWDDVENGIFRTFNIFSKLDYDYVNHKVICKIDETFAYLLNDFGKNNPFTSFEFEQFFKLTAKHSKNLYRQLMQWKTKGSMYISIDDFRMIFGLSDKYSPRDIKAKVINPSIKELLDKNYFAKLVCETSTHGKGGKVYGYNFYFAEAVNDQVPGQMYITDFLEDPNISKDEKNKTLKVANDILKGKKKNTKKPGGFQGREYSDDFLNSLIDNGVNNG